MSFFLRGRLTHLSLKWQNTSGLFFCNSLQSFIVWIITLEPRSARRSKCLDLDFVDVCLIDLPDFRLSWISPLMMTTRLVEKTESHDQQSAKPSRNPTIWAMANIGLQNEETGFFYFMSIQNNVGKGYIFLISCYRKIPAECTETMACKWLRNHDWELGHLDDPMNSFMSSKMYH